MDGGLALSTNREEIVVHRRELSYEVDVGAYCLEVCMRVQTPVLTTDGTSWIHTFHLPYFFGNIFGPRGPQFHSIFMHELRLSEGLQNCMICNADNPNDHNYNVRDVQAVLRREQLTFVEDAAPIAWASPLLTLDVTSHELLNNVIRGVRRYRARGTLTIVLFFNPNYGVVVDDETDDADDDDGSLVEYGLERGLGFVFRGVPCELAPLCITGQPLGGDRMPVCVLHRASTGEQEAYETTGDFLGRFAWGLLTVENSFAERGRTLRYAIDFVDRMRGGAAREARLGGRIYLYERSIFRNIIDYITRDAAVAGYDYNCDTLCMYGDDPLVAFACSGMLGIEFERHISVLGTVVAAVDYTKLDASPVSVFEGPRQLVYMTAKMVERCLQRAIQLNAEYELYIATELQRIAANKDSTEERRIAMDDSV